MARNRDSLQRRKPLRQPKPRFLIVCEGIVTEPRYFKDVRHIERASSISRSNPAGHQRPSSNGLLSGREKPTARRESSRTTTKSTRKYGAYSTLDEHPLIPEARDQARANGIELAISNPCFELWALLHFQDQRAHIERGKVQHLCRRHMRNYEKQLDYQILRPKYSDALKRAEDLEKWHDSRGTAGANPSTTVYRLVERIKAQTSSQ